MPTQEEEHIEIIDAISNFATSTAANSTVVANLATKNAALVKELASITAKIVTSMTKVDLVTQQLYDFRASNKGGGSVHKHLNNNHC